MNVESLLADDRELRDDALSVASTSPEHERSGYATKLAVIARDAADALTAADVGNKPTAAPSTRLRRTCYALARLRVEVGKSCLLRVADEGSAIVKATLANALRDTNTAEGRAVLVHLLADDEARADAIVAIGASPWPEALPALIDVAEGDDQTARLAVRSIARCGSCGPKELYAAADYLYEQLDDDHVLSSAVDALLRYGRTMPNVVTHARELAKQPGKRKAAGLCLFAVCANEGNAALLELSMVGGPADPDDVKAFLTPLLRDDDEDIRTAADRTWKVLNLS